LQINPSNVKANFRKGLALHASGQYKEALPVLAAAAKIEPSNKQIQQALKFCEVRLEQEHRKRMS
jgi:FK506-binding protein 8